MIFTKNQLRVLEYLHKKGEAHLLEISRALKIHPYSLHKTLKAVNKILIKRKVGRTVLLSIDKLIPNYLDLICTIESFMLETKKGALKILIKDLQRLFSKNKNVLACCIFGSYARSGQTKDSDVDILFVVKKKCAEIDDLCSKLSQMLNKEVNQIVLTENEFKTALKTREPAIVSLLEPSQRLLISGKEWFLKAVQDE